MPLSLPLPPGKILICGNLALTCISPENMLTYALGVVIRDLLNFKKIPSVDDIASDDFRVLSQMQLPLAIWGTSQRDSWHYLCVTCG